MVRKHDRDGLPRPEPAPRPVPPPPSSDPSVNGQPEKEVIRGRFQKPAVETRGQIKTAGAAPAGDAFNAYPALVAFLAEQVWADGSPRLTGTLLLFVESGRWGCCLTHRAPPTGKAFLSARTLQELFEDLETALESDRLDWRAPATNPRR